MKEEMPKGFTDADLQEFCGEIVECLVKYGGLSQEQAERQLDDSGFCTREEFVGTVLARQLFFHVLPYHWAMDILYGKENPNWANDA